MANRLVRASEAQRSNESTGSMFGTWVRRESAFGQSLSRAAAHMEEVRAAVSSQGYSGVVYGNSRPRYNHWTSGCGGLTVFTVILFSLLVLGLQVSPGLTENILLGGFLLSLFFAVHCCIRDVKEYNMSSAEIASRRPNKKFKASFANVFHLITIAEEYIQLAAFAFPPGEALAENPDLPQAHILEFVALFGFTNVPTIFEIVFVLALLIPLGVGFLFVLAALFDLKTVEEYLNSIPPMLFLPCMRIFVAGLVCTCVGGLNETLECDSEITLDADPDTVCWTGRHVLVSLGSFGGILLYYPLLSLFQLRFVPAEITYKPKFSYYTSQIKLILVVITSYFTNYMTRPGRVWSWVLAAVVANAILLLMQFAYRPCNIPEINYYRSALNMLSLWTSTGLFLRVVWSEAAELEQTTYETYFLLGFGGLILGLSLLYGCWKTIKRDPLCSCIGEDGTLSLDLSSPGSPDEIAGAVIAAAASAAGVPGAGVIADAIPGQRSSKRKPIPSNTHFGRSTELSGAANGAVKTKKKGSNHVAAAVVLGQRDPPPRPPSAPSPSKRRKPTASPQKQKPSGSGHKSPQKRKASSPSKRKASSPSKRKASSPQKNSPRKSPSKRSPRPDLADGPDVRPSVDDITGGFLRRIRNFGRGRTNSSEDAGQGPSSGEGRRVRSRSESPKSLRVKDKLRTRMAGAFRSPPARPGKKGAVRSDPLVPTGQARARSPGEVRAGRSPRGKSKHKHHHHHDHGHKHRRRGDREQTPPRPRGRSEQTPRSPRAPNAPAPRARGATIDSPRNVSPGQLGGLELAGATLIPGTGTSDVSPAQYRVPGPDGGEGYIVTVQPASIDHPSPSPSSRRRQRPHGKSPAAGRRSPRPARKPMSTMDMAALQWEDELSEMAKMGFTNRDANIKALLASKGNLTIAVNLLVLGAST